MEPEQLSSAFPFPPPYFKFFTSQNIESLKSNTIPDSPEKKRELEYLIPPPAPIEGSYSSFGDVWPVSPLQTCQLTIATRTSSLSDRNGRDTIIFYRCGIRSDC